MNKPFIDYKKLEIYQQAQQFVLDIYELVKNFPKYEDNNLTSQLRRAATCVPLNIAEGSAAGSYRIFLNYLIFGYRSTKEIAATLELCKRLGYLTEDKYTELIIKLNTLIGKLYNYINYLDKNAGERKWDKSYYYRQQKYYADNNQTTQTNQREEMKRLC